MNGLFLTVTKEEKENILDKHKVFMMDMQLIANLRI